MPQTKFLILARHATAEDNHPDGDFYRALTIKGRSEAEKLANFINNQLTSRHIEANSIVLVTSDAIRTKETASYIEKYLSINIISNSKLYNSSSNVIKVVATEKLATNESVILIGHNPGISEAASILSKQFVSFSPSEAIVLACSGEVIALLNAIEVIDLYKRSS